MDYPAKRILTGFLLFMISIKDVSPAMHITKMTVPEIISTDDGAWLDCAFRTDGDDRLYALKWYLGLDEFYRWTPAEDPQMKTFPIVRDPITVDLDRSVKGKIWVTKFSLEAAGVYRCEVSAEAPSFHTASKISSLTVVDLPDSKPIISGDQPSYQMHEEVILNCSSPLSNPRANLTFYINDEQADGSWLTHYKSIEDYPTGLETAVLGLRFLLWPHLTNRGSVSIKCTAELSNIYWDSSEKLIRVDMPYQASVMEGRASSANGLLTTGMNMMTRLPAAIIVYLVL